MICKTCNKIMSITGTSYEKRKNKDGSNRFLHRSYCECEKYRYRRYTKSPNF